MEEVPIHNDDDDDALSSQRGYNDFKEAEPIKEDSAALSNQESVQESEEQDSIVNRVNILKPATKSDSR